MNELTKKALHLSQRRQLFADAVLQGVSPIKAFVDAGYAPKSAKSNSSRLMTKDVIKAYMAHHRQEIAERNNITLDEIVKNTREIILRCMQHAKVLDKKGDQVYIETPNGDIVPAYTFQASEALKGNELLAKLAGLFKDAGDDRGDTYIGIMFKGVPAHLEGKLDQSIKDKPSHHLKEANPQDTLDVH